MKDSARDIMTPSPHTIQSSESVMGAAQLMRKSDIGDVIVVEGKRLVGILTDRDIVVRALAGGMDPEATPVSEICSRELTTVRPTDSVAPVLKRAVLPVAASGEILTL